MPDISMCKDHNCPIKKTCYRYTATPSLYQSYADFKAEDERGCSYYWETELKEEKDEAISKN